VPLPPPIPRVDVTLDLGDGPVDLGTRALTAAAVAPPRFGRESELLAATKAATAAGADMVDVSLELRLVGAVARGADLPVVSRVGSVESAEAARAAGVAVLLVAADLTDLADRAAGEGWAAALVVDELAQVEAARGVAERHGFPLAIDTTRLAAADAIAHEAVAISSGCRIVRTTDVRRSRRVVEVLAALLEARRDP
jgi:hypothetical protein